MSSSEDNVTTLLRSWRGGDAEALESLVPVVYAELRKIAAAHLRGERAGHTLNSTDLVHEAFLRFDRVSSMSFNDRQHFFGMASRLMRRILVDHARHRDAQKRGGRNAPVTLSRIQEVVGSDHGTEEQPDLLVLDKALRSLEARDERACRVVEMRFFGGLSREEVADVLEVSRSTVRRDWTFAKAFLRRELAL